jgi:hypothetical protein
MARRKTGYRAILKVWRDKEGLPMGQRRQAAKQMAKMAERIIRGHVAQQEFARGRVQTTEGPVRGSEKRGSGSSETPNWKLGSVERYNRQYALRESKRRGDIDMHRTGSMMSALEGGYQFRGGDISAQVKFADRRAAQIFRYHQVYGAGVNRIRRVFVYFTPRERKRIMNAAMQHVL